MNEQEKRDLEELKRWKKSLESSSSIPLNIDQSFRARFLGSSLKVSSKGVDTADVTVVSSVNFGAQTVGTTVVLDDPTGFLEIVIGSTTYYLPYYS